MKSSKRYLKVLCAVSAAVLAASMTATALLIGVNAAEASATLDKHALELVVGESDALTAAVAGGDAVWSSSDEKIVTVDADGKLKGIAPGKATVTVKVGGASDECAVYVVEKEYGFDDDIMISIFWPPTTNYINDEQYKLMADAGITWVMGSGDNLGQKEKQLKMLELCYKYGIRMTVGDSRFGSNLLKLKASRIEDLVREYRNIPGANGYYLLDEPYNPNTFFDAYKTMKALDPSAYMHLNFLPYASYPSVAVYKSQMNDWLKLCASTGHPQDYLMYDLYPYGLAPNSMNRDGFFTNLEAVREVGLENNVKTGTYIQSVTQEVAFRSPNKAETRYEINAALAFGIKQLSYFTWFTPKDRSEPFIDGIISWDGIPNAKYEFICELNAIVHNLGKTLVRCDALEVYFSKTKYGGVQRIPEDFFVQCDSSKDVIVSYLRDKTTGRNYCMVVNNNFNKDIDVDLTFIPEIKSLQVVSEDNGQLMPLPMDAGNTLNVNLDAGGEILIALPEDYDYSAGKDRRIADGENIAAAAQVYCDSSLGANGMYMDNLNDGVRFSDGSSNGWQSDGRTAEIKLDLGDTYTFNRIDLYPVGTATDYGTNMPKDFAVQYSRDGEKWYTVAKAEGFKVEKDTVPSLVFDEVTGRYVRIVVTATNGKTVSMCEIEIYRDNGSVAKPASVLQQIVPEARGKTSVTYKPGSNLALNKSVTVSSYPAGQEYKGWGWWPDFLVDGNPGNGWTSNVKLHMDEPDATEYAFIDLGDFFNIEKLTVTPNGCWPEDYEVRVSDDGNTWKTVYAVTDSAKETKPTDLKPDAGSHGRYVMFAGTKLRGTATDGYMLQLGEIEVYGTPYIDTAEANEMLAKYVGAGGSDSSDSYKAVTAALDDKNTTQSALDVLMKKMLAEVDLKLPERLPEIETFEYTFNYGPFPDEGKPGDEETTAEETTAAEDETSPDETEPTASVGTEDTTGAATEAPASETTAEDAKTTGCCGDGNVLSVFVALMAAAILALRVMMKIGDKKYKDGDEDVIDYEKGKKKRKK